MYIEIKEGLKEGQEVVVAPYLAISKMLKNGMQIEIVSKEDLYTSDEKK
jgi:HlyD family secretion protein